VRKITKEKEPKPLTLWKRKNPGKGYKELDCETRQAIRNVCLTEHVKFGVKFGVLKIGNLGSDPDFTILFDFIEKNPKQRLGFLIRQFLRA